MDPVTKRATMPAVVMCVMILLVAVLAALNMSDIGKKKTWDREFPMANAHVDWQQTYYSGAWSDGR